MEETLKVLNELESKGLVQRYAIGGAMAAIFYIEPVLTYDMDVFVFLPPSKSKLTSLSPIYRFLKEKGYREDKEHVGVEGIPVQFIPAYNPLVEEAVEQAKQVSYKGVNTRVLRPEHLLAIMLETNRPKDRARMTLFLEEAEIDSDKLAKVIQRHGLSRKWELFKKQSL